MGCRLTLCSPLPRTSSYIYTSGIWVYGDDRQNFVTDTTPINNPVALVAWRPAVEQQVVTSQVLNGVVVLFSSDGLQPRHTHLPHRWAHAPGPWRERVGAPVQGWHCLLLDCVLVQRIACRESDTL